MSSSTARTAAIQAAVAPKPTSKHDSALKTPSWTDIVAAYHSEGNGDREMLLALLHAKAKEDERLAALDLLRAEQLRAYSSHLAVHGPLYPPAAPMPSPSYLPPHSGQANPQHHHLQQLPQQHYRHHQQQSGLASPAMPSGSLASSLPSSSTSRSKSSKGQRKGSSRSPSLSHSVESRLSSPDILVRTPDDERRMSGLSLTDAANARDAILLPPPNMRKRKSPSHHSAEDATAASRAAKRISPDRQTLPPIADILPSSDSNAEAKRAASPRSLQHILNQDLRPLSMSNYRAQTSDVRGSPTEEDELAA